MPDQTGPDFTDGPDFTNGNQQQGERSGSGLGPVLREQASKLADRSKEAGVDAADAIGKAAARAAQELQDGTPELANYLRDAATYTQKLATDLRDRPASDLLSEAVEWGRKQPLIALAGAAVLGFALSRVVKTGLPAGDADKGAPGA